MIIIRKQHVLGALVQWLKLPAWNVGDRGFEPDSGLQVSKKHDVSSPLTRKDPIIRSLRDREVVCSASDCQGSNFESCVWRAVSSHSTYHPQEVLLAQFTLYVHKGGLKPHLFHFFGNTTLEHYLIFVH